MTYVKINMDSTKISVGAIHFVCAKCLEIVLLCICGAFLQTKKFKMDVAPRGIEPMTFALLARRSNQLS